MALFSHHDLNAFITSYGYWAIAVIVALESMGLPLPGETMLILGAGYAGGHGGSLLLVILSATAGAIVGDNIGYAVGRELGARFLHAYGSKIGLTPARLKLGQYLFMRYGGKVVFIGRFIAVLRVLAAFPRRQCRRCDRVGDGHRCCSLLARPGNPSDPGSNRSGDGSSGGCGGDMDHFLSAPARSGDAGGGRESLSRARSMIFFLLHVIAPAPRTISLTAKRGSSYRYCRPA
jgi:membrane protein YqaA with SNARE-associated domain